MCCCCDEDRVVDAESIILDLRQLLAQKDHEIAALHEELKMVREARLHLVAEKFGWTVEQATAAPGELR